LAATLHSLGVIELKQSNYAVARTFFEQSLVFSSLD